MKKYLIFIVFFSFISVIANNKVLIYNAYIDNNMNTWKIVIDNMNLKSDKTNEFIIELINYQYGYIGSCIGNGKFAEAKKYTVLAKKYLDVLESRKYKMSYVYAYKSAFNGFDIAIDWYKAPFIGYKSILLAESAIKSDKENYFAYIQYANTKNYMPETFGGSKLIALEYYKKAQNLLEKNKYNILYNWNYINLLVVISEIYIDLEKESFAKEYYKKILEIEPKFSWIENKLKK